MRLEHSVVIGVVIALVACGGKSPPPLLFDPPPSDPSVRVGPTVPINLRALDNGPFRFELEGKTFTPTLVRTPRAGDMLVHGTFGVGGTLVIARIGKSVTGVFRHGGIGLEIVPVPGGHQIIKRSWLNPRNHHAASWALSKVPGLAPTLVNPGPVDVSIHFAYTSAALAKRGGLSGITGLVAVALDDLNTACKTSKVNVTFSSAGIVQTEGTEQGRSMEVLFDELLDKTGDFATAHQDRAKDRGDILVLIVDRGDGYLGYGTIMGKPQDAVAIVDQADALWYLLIPHEVGHVMGGLHDSDTRDDPYPISHGYVDDVGSNGRDVMSDPCAYPPACPLKTRWSQPEDFGDEQWRNVAEVIRKTAPGVATFGDNIP